MELVIKALREAFSTKMSEISTLKALAPDDGKGVQQMRGPV